jgi:hypothetical protein
VITILVSYARSGTKSIARFLRHFGISSAWQKHGSMLKNSRLYKLEGPYNFNFHMKELEKYRFQANWELAYWMKAVQETSTKKVDFLVMTRDPYNACGSRIHRARLVKGRKRHPGYTLEAAARKYDEVYSIILDQLPYLDPKPKWMAFEKYIKGEYTEKLFEKFNIEKTEENFIAANDILKRKVNSYGEYETEFVKPILDLWPPLEKSRMMRRIIETMTEEL